MIYYAILVCVVGLGLPICVVVASRAQSKTTIVALEGIARQPEAAGRIQLAMIIGLALIESLVLYVLLTFFLLQGQLPAFEQVLEIVKSASLPPAAN